MKEFRSKFTGKCAKCQGVINIGDPISWDRKAIRGQRTWHKSCVSYPVSTGPDDAPSVSSVDTSTLTIINHINETSAPVIEALTTPDGESAPVMNETVSNEQDPIATLARAIVPFLPVPKVSVDEAKVRHEIEMALDGRLYTAIDEALKKLDRPLSVTIETPDREPKTIQGSVHKVFPEVLAVANARESVYLRGPAGSGKSSIARQVAEALELPFGMISLNVQTADYKLFGSMDAHNSYRGTAFREKFEQGGVFLIDEIDNASGNLLTTLNTALANGHMAFPDGLVARHPDFICIATGNTAGRGASRLHSERRALDSATLDRFYSILVEYDWTLVRSIAKAQNPKADAWVDWTKQASEYCAKNLPTMIISPRCAIMGAKLAKLENIKSIDALADGVAFKGIDDTSRRAIVDNVKLPALTDLR